METQHYTNLFNFLLNQEYPTIFNTTQQRQLKTQAEHYTIKHNLFYKKDRNNTKQLI